MSLCAPFPVLIHDCGYSCCHHVGCCAVISNCICSLPDLRAPLVSGHIGVPPFLYLIIALRSKPTIKSNVELKEVSATSDGIGFYSYEAPQTLRFGQGGTAENILAQNNGRFVVPPVHATICGRAQHAQQTRYSTDLGCNISTSSSVTGRIPSQIRVGTLATSLRSRNNI